MSSRKLATRIQRLGTETAYAVSDEAKKYKAEGKTVYDFHIGDLNFGSCPAAMEATKKALDEGKTGYCSAKGIPELRKAIAEFTSKERGLDYDAEAVSVQPGGKPVIMKFLMAVMEEGDEVLYPNPGYPIYESLIRYLGGVPKPYTFSDTPSGFVLNMEHLKAQVSSKTKVLIYNNLQNPTGHMSSDEEMKEIADLAVANDWWVLSDEPYFHIVYNQPHGKSIVSLPGMKERTVLLLTTSKSWGMTGWRLGAAVGPKEVISVVTKLTTNDEGCTNHFVQWGVIAAFEDWKQCASSFNKSIVVELKKRRDLLIQKLNEIPGFQAHSPPSTFYAYVNVTKAFKLLKIAETCEQEGLEEGKDRSVQEYEKFRRMLLDNTGISVCTREHFGSSACLRASADNSIEESRYIRFAFSGITCPLIQEACEKLHTFMSTHAG